MRAIFPVPIPLRWLYRPTRGVTAVTDADEYYAVAEPVAVDQPTTLSRLIRLMQGRAGVHRHLFSCAACPLRRGTMSKRAPRPVVDAAQGIVESGQRAGQPAGGSRSNAAAPCGALATAPGRPVHRRARRRCWRSASPAAVDRRRQAQAGRGAAVPSGFIEPACRTLALCSPNAITATRIQRVAPRLGRT